MSVESELTYRVRAIVADVLGVPLDRITAETRSDHVQEWDSLRHIRVILAVEQEFGVRFSEDEIPRLTGIDALVTRLATGC